MRWLLLFAVFVLSLSAPSARAAEVGTTVKLAPPVDGGIVKSFERPELRWGPGHRGIDYSAPLGAPVRAAAAGRVVFAGVVANVSAVTIDHGGGLQTTYTSLSDITVVEAQQVYEGEWIGRVGTAHPDEGSGESPGQGGLHFGVKLHGGYVDPAAFLGPVDVAGAIRLAPLAWSLPPGLPAAFTDPIEPGAGDHVARCADPVGAPTDVAPNDNIAVAVAGIASRTKGGVDAEMYEHGPENLGYPAGRVYRFSYEGLIGPRLHTPYERTATYADLRRSAWELRRLLERIAHEHPGAEVDLIAHSQGGLLARYLLGRLATAWDQSLPRVEHLVTFSTPHEGAPLADAPADIESRSLTGKVFVDLVSEWSRGGAIVPDPRSSAVMQMRPGSQFLTDLAREDIVFGTRALSLGILNDAVVPADRTRIDHELNRIVGPAGWNGHSGILVSDQALAIAHGFLRDGPTPCRSGADDWAGVIGGAIGWVESQIGWAYGKLEELSLRGLKPRGG